MTATPVIQSGEVSFHIITNLPDGMTLVVDLYNDDSTYHEQDMGIYVKDGVADTIFFSDNNNPLKKGKYDLQIISPFSFVQSETVQNVIGKHGEYMRGNLVIDDSAINFNGLYSVKYDKEFNI